ncbi:MAG: archaeal proteasome endopeptidase complex subunit alpha [Candidatus Diapherotrites archaeon]
MYPVSQTGGYDRVATMFSPDGRLYQVEYAGKIVSQGTLAAALKYDKGVLFGADKKVPSRLLLPESIEKMFKVDNHIVAVSAGLVGDARRLVQIARQKAQENRMYYDEPINVETLVKEISNINQIFTQYGGMRPFGVSFIFGGIDETGNRLFETEPSGALAEYTAVAIGKNKHKAMELLEKDYKEGLSFDAGIQLLVDVLKKGLDEKEKLDYKRLEFSFVEEGKREFERIPVERLKGFVSNNKQS